MARRNRTVHESILRETLDKLEKKLLDTKKMDAPFEDWQVEVVLEQKKDIMQRCSRKAGKSFCDGAKIACEAIVFENKFVGIISAGQRAASELFDIVIDFLLLMDVEFREKPTATGCTLANGHRIISLPTGFTGATSRNYSFWKMYWDEAAFIYDEVRKALKPCLLKQGVQEIISSSTHGSRGWFYEEWNSPRDMLRIYIPWWDIKHIPMDRLKKMIEEERSLYGDKYVQQEYEALFVDEGAGLIPENLINDAVKDIDYEERLKGALYLGVTCAPLGKNIAYIILCRRSHDRLTVVDLKVVENYYNRASAIVETIRDISKAEHVSKIVTSETTLGTGTLDYLTGIFGMSRVLSVENLNHNKERLAEGRRGRVKEKDLYDFLVTMMERKQLHILRNDIIIDALRSLDYDYKKNKENEIVIFGRAKVVVEALVYSLVPYMLHPYRKLWIKGMNIEKPLNSWERIR